jgi:hypothetical protein
VGAELVTVSDRRMLGGKKWQKHIHKTEEYESIIYIADTTLERRLKMADTKGEMVKSWIASIMAVS